MRLRTAAIAILAATLVGGAPRAAERLPYALELRIRFEGNAPSASVADDAAAAVLAELRSNGCFRDARVAPAKETPDADVLLDLLISGIQEEVRYEQSLAERAQPLDGDAVAMGYSVMLSFQVDLKLAALPGGTVARSDRFHVAAERRPRTPADDAREGAKTEAMIDLARKTRKAVCKGSMSKLAGKIEEARRAP